MSSIVNKINEVGLINTVIGIFRRTYYKRLQKKYDFYDWHVSPYELRGYAQATAKYVTEHNKEDGLVIDLGCGMGEVISHIKGSKKIGYDLDKLIIDVAKKVHSKANVEFRPGSFDELCDASVAKMNINYLLTLGFMHGSTEDKWVDYYHNIANKHDISHIVVDVIPSGVNGSHQLDFTKILPSNYHLEDRLGPFLSDRYIEIYKKNV